MYAYSELSIFLHLDRSIMCMVQPIQPLEQALITLVICKYYAQLLLVLVIQTVSLTLCPFSPLGGSQGNPFVFSKKKHTNLQMTLGDFGLISWFSTMKAKINGSPSWISSTSSVILRCVERAAREYTNIIHASSRQSWLWRNVWISHYLWSLRANATLTTGLDHFQTRDLEERQTDLGIKFRVTQSQSPAHWSFMIPWLVRNCSLNEEKRGELTQKLPRCLKHLTDLDSAVICKKHSAGKSRSLKSDHGKKWPTLAWFNMFNEVTSSGSDLFEILSQGASVRSSSGSQHPSICRSLDLLHSSSFCLWTKILSKQRRNELKRTEKLKANHTPYTPREVSG